MQGMDRHTGRLIGGLAHLRQSIRDRLETGQGARVMRRTYGSRLPRLVDRGITPQLEVELVQAAAEALRGEPRFSVQRVLVAEARAGGATVDVEGVYRPDGRVVRIEGVTL